MAYSRLRDLLSARHPSLVTYPWFVTPPPSPRSVPGLFTTGTGMAGTGRGPEQRIPTPTCTTLIPIRKKTRLSDVFVPQVPDILAPNVDPGPVLMPLDTLGPALVGPSVASRVDFIQINCGKRISAMTQLKNNVRNKIALIQKLYTSQNGCTLIHKRDFFCFGMATVTDGHCEESGKWKDFFESKPSLFSLFLERKERFQSGGEKRCAEERCLVLPPAYSLQQQFRQGRVSPAYFLRQQQQRRRGGKEGRKERKLAKWTAIGRPQQGEQFIKVTETIKTWQVWTMADGNLPEGVKTFSSRILFRLEHILAARRFRDQRPLCGRELSSAIPCLMATGRKLDS
jgi:hypothetical protein